MLDLKFVGLIIRDKNSNIIAIARERYDGMLIFGTLKENEAYILEQIELLGEAKREILDK